MIRKVTRSPTFIKQTKHLDSFLLGRLRYQINKILDDSLVGKPLKYKKGERLLYIKPFRLIYTIIEDELILLKFDYRRKVYK